MGGLVSEGDVPWRSLPAAQAVEAMTHPGVVIADLREASRSKADPFPGAILVASGDYDRMAQMAAGCDTLYLICGLGKKSMLAARELATRGVTNVVNIVGGMRAIHMEQD
jgi:rhodanese-related sulfurtransferase